MSPRSRLSARSTPFVRRLEHRVLTFVRDREVLHHGESIIVGVSGGPDSTALLILLTRLRSDLGLRITAAHFDHRLRSPEEAEGDRRFVEQICGSLSVALVSGAGDVKRRARREAESVEEAARNLRYRFLGAQAKRVGATAVVVGHTLDDRAETALLHIIRGSGLDGLAAMPPRAGWPFGVGPQIARPLLVVTRAEVERYCRELGVQPRRDPTNDLLIATRNRVRRQLMPVLRELNPKVSQALNRLADAAAQDTAFIDAAANTEWARLAEVTAARVEFSQAALSQLHPALAVRLLRQAAARVGTQPEAVHLERVLRALGKRRARVTLPGGVATVESGRVAFAREAAARTAKPMRDRPLSVPGRTHAGEWTIEATRVEPDAIRPRDTFGALLDVDALDGPLLVRSRKPGDRLRPLGLGGSKKLQDILVDAKVPAAARDGIPLIADRRGIIWIAGHCIDERAAVTQKTRRVLRLRARRRSSH
jgi:tRNA(Ile)-lysidine synthase